MTVRRVVGVIGGGPAGLAAAWRLVEAGHGVVVHERRLAVGGLMRTDEAGGARVDVGVQLLATTYGRTLRLVESVGAGDLLAGAPGRDGLWRRGRAHPIQYGSVASMVTSTALPGRLKLRLATRYLGFLATRCRGLDANDPAGSGGAAFDDESIAEYGARELGTDFVELMAYPFLGAYHSGVPESTSAAFYHALARVGLDVRLVAVRGGVGRVAGAVAEAVVGRGGEVRTGAAVERMQVERDGVHVRAGGEDFRHDAVVVATPAAEAARLTDVAPLREWLAGVESQPSVAVAVVTAAPVRADYFALAFPRVAKPGDRIVTACVQSSKVGGLVPEGGGLVVAYAAPGFVPTLLEMAPERIPAELVPDLDVVFGGLSATIRLAKVYRHTEGQTQFYPGYLRHLLGYDEGWLPARVALAGDYLVAPTVEGAVRSGERAAERLLGALD